MLYTAPLLSSSSAKIIEGEYIIVFKREASTDEGERERERERTLVLVHNVVNVPIHFLAVNTGCIPISLYDYYK